MGEQRNLTEENVEELREQLEKMQKTNPDLEFRFFEQAEPEPMHDKTITKIYDKLLELERKIDHIFGDHVLIKGQFQDISDKSLERGS